MNPPINLNVQHLSGNPIWEKRREYIETHVTTQRCDIKDGVQCWQVYGFQGHIGTGQTLMEAVDKLIQMKGSTNDT